MFPLHIFTLYESSWLYSSVMQSCLLREIQKSVFAIITYYHWHNNNNNNKPKRTLNILLSSHLIYRLGIGKSGIEDALSCLSLLQFVHSNSIIYYLSHGFIMLKSLQAGATHNCWTNSWSNGSEGIHLKLVPCI